MQRSWCHCLCDCEDVGAKYLRLFACFPLNHEVLKYSKFFYLKWLWSWRAGFSVENSESTTLTTVRHTDSYFLCLCHLLISLNYHLNCQLFACIYVYQVKKKVFGKSIPSPSLPPAVPVCWWMVVDALWVWLSTTWPSPPTSPLEMCLPSQTLSSATPPQWTRWHTFLQL